MRSRMTISSGEEDSATSASANWWRTSHGGGGGGGGGGCAPPLSNSNWNEFQSWSPNITQSEDNLSNTFTNTSNDSQELAESCASLSLLQSTVQMEPNSTVSDSQMWSQVLLGVGNREVQGNMYEEGMTSEAPRAESLEVSGLVRKMEEEETPCWEFVNLAPFHGEDLNATNNNINMARQIAPLNYNNIDGSNYGISNLSSWSLAYPQNVQQPIHADFNHGSMNAFRSGLEFPMPNFELKQKSRLSHTVTPPLGTEGYKRKALPRILESKSNSLNSPDASSGVGARCYTGTLLAVEGRWQFNSLNKPLLDFPGKNQPQSSPHHQTMGNVQRREPNNNEIMKRRTTTETTSHETIFKRPRLEGASLPSKVPKAKLGDRITALQQLVSPFGKTDTASVLLEAIGYIKFLQEQVQVLSAPYMKSKGVCQGDQKYWGHDYDKKDTKETKQDLKSRGLCLVPLSCTFQVSHDSSTSNPDYWRTSFGDGIYR